jgi:hypothetical protein
MTDFTWIYYVAGGIVLFLFLMFFGFQFLAYLIMGRGTKPIDEEQKNRCEEEIAAGRAPSMMCRVYVKKRKCPNGNCMAMKK